MSISLKAIADSLLRPIFFGWDRLRQRRVEHDLVVGFERIVNHRMDGDRRIGVERRPGNREVETMVFFRLEIGRSLDE